MRASRRTASRRAPAYTRELPERGDLHAVVRRARECARWSRAHTTQRICASASRSAEVPVAVAVRLEVADLAAHPERHERAFEDVLAPSASASRRRSPTPGLAPGTSSPTCVVAARATDARRRGQLDGAAATRRRRTATARRLQRRLRAATARQRAGAFTRRLRAARTVFCSSMAIVIGPTPPGTGVMSDATSPHAVEVHVADEPVPLRRVAIVDAVHARRRSRRRPA